LTERGKAVLRFVFQFRKNNEIGARVDIAEAAVKAPRASCSKRPDIAVYDGVGDLRCLEQAS
jgi:FixJ family two-component response regulator